MRMKKKLFLVLILFASIASAGDLTFPNYGFTIDGLDAQPVGSSSKSLAMYLPAENGFAANIYPINLKMLG